MESTGQRPDEFAMEYGAFLMDWLTARAGFHQVRWLSLGALPAGLVLNLF